MVSGSLVGWLVGWIILEKMQENTQRDIETWRLARSWQSTRVKRGNSVCRREMRLPDSRAPCASGWLQFQFLWGSLHSYFWVAARFLLSSRFCVSIKPSTNEDQSESADKSADLTQQVYLGHLWVPLGCRTAKKMPQRPRRTAKKMPQRPRRAVLCVTATHCTGQVSCYLLGQREAVLRGQITESICSKLCSSDLTEVAGERPALL